MRVSLLIKPTPRPTRGISINTRNKGSPIMQVIQSPTQSIAFVTTLPTFSSTVAIVNTTSVSVFFYSPFIFAYMYNGYLPIIRFTMRAINSSIVSATKYFTGALIKKSDVLLNIIAQKLIISVIF